MTKGAKTSKSTTNEVAAAGKFGGALFDIGWQLAITVFTLLVLGRWLDNRYSTDPLFALVGLVLIVLSFILILRRTLQKIPKSQGGLGLEDGISKMEGGKK